MIIGMLPHLISPQQFCQVWNIQLLPKSMMVLVLATDNFTQQVPYGGSWMIENHPRSRPSHDYPDSFLHLSPITMNWAFLAGGLILAVTAFVKTAVGITQQFLTFWTQLCMSFILSTIQTYHLLHHSLFFLYTFSIHLFLMPFLPCFLTNGYFILSQYLPCQV